MRLPFAVFGLLTAATLVPIARLRLPEAPTGAGPRSRHDRRVIRRLAADRRIIAAMLVVVSFRYSIGVFEPLWATHLTDLGASTTLISFSLASFALPMLVVARPAGRLSDRFGSRWASLLAALATVPMMATYGYAGVVWLILLMAVPHGLMEPSCRRDHRPPSPRRRPTTMRHRPRASARLPGPRRRPSVPSPPRRCSIRWVRARPG